MNAAFYAGARQLFGGELTQGQVNGFEVIGEAWDKAGDGNPRHLAYIFATALHETAKTMQPVRETLAKTDAKAKEILTKSWKAGKLPWVKSDYWSGGFFGRGYVQLTHKANYQKAGEKLGLDLVSDPSKAMIPEVAALILVRGMLEGWFTGKKLSDFKSDFVSARAVVNGSDRATLIAAYAYHFLEALQAAAAPSAPSPAPIPPEAPVAPPAKRWSLLGAIISFILSLFKKGPKP
jgi:hypothetical protein